VQSLKVGGGSEVEFGGDASPVEAGSSEVFFLDEGDRFSSLTGEQSCGITARTRSYDNDVKMAHGNSRMGLNDGRVNETRESNRKQVGTQPLALPVRLGQNQCWTGIRPIYLGGWGVANMENQNIQA
jgi:hypothetical protein